jgi:hypothetical protein
MEGKKLPRRSLGMARSTSPALVVSTRAVPVALVGAVVGALIASGADQRGQLGLDQLLADQADGFSDQIEPSPDWKAASSSDRTDWSRAIGVYSFGAFGQEHTEDHAAGPLMGGPSDSLQNPPLWGTLPPKRKETVTCRAMV